jgi:hypothetical protein
VRVVGGAGLVLVTGATEGATDGAVAAVVWKTVACCR